MPVHAERTEAPTVKRSPKGSEISVLNRTYKVDAPYLPKADAKIVKNTL